MCYLFRGWTWHTWKNIYVMITSLLLATDVAGWFGRLRFVCIYDIFTLLLYTKSSIFRRKFKPFHFVCLMSLPYLSVCLDFNTYNNEKIRKKCVWSVLLEKITYLHVDTGTRRSSGSSKLNKISHCDLKNNLLLTKYGYVCILGIKCSYPSSSYAHNSSWILKLIATNDPVLNVPLIYATSKTN